jgi:Zn-dependent protease
VIGRGADLKLLFDPEERRSRRNGRPFTLLRVAPPVRAGDPTEVERLRAAVASVLRSTDLVRALGGEVVAVLLEASPLQAAAPVTRVGAALEAAKLGFSPRVGWATVGPGQRSSWQEAWRWAGALLLAAPAAA